MSSVAPRSLTRPSQTGRPPAARAAAEDRAQEADDGVAGVVGHLGADAVDLLDEGGAENLGRGPLRYRAAVAQDEEAVAVHRGEVEIVQSDHRGDRQAGDQLQEVS
jgi:hypothetical protein